MGYLQKVFAIVWKDVRAELRTKDILSSMLVFAALAVVIFQFAFDLRADNARLVLPGVVWIAITFSGVLGLNRSFILEQDRGSMEGLLLAPMDRSVIYFGKLIGNLLFIFAVELVLLPLASIFFNVWIVTPSILLVVFLGTVGFAAVGTLFAALSVNTPARGDAAHSAVPDHGAGAYRRRASHGRPPGRRDTARCRAMATAVGGV